MARTRERRLAGMARVLIVEDEHLLRRILTLNLVRHGYSVAEADSVASAREALAAWDPAFDVMLLDIELPDGSGWDVLRVVRQASAITEMATAPPPGAPPRVVVVTALRPAQARLDEFRPDAVLVKPFPVQALLRLIERVLAVLPSAVDEDAAALEAAEG
jgi:CheY-like chemotaxis protein